MYNKVEKILYSYLEEIEYKIMNKQSISENELFYFLECIVSDIRDKIYDEGHPNFESKCDLAQSIICHYLNDIGVVNYPCSTNNTIYSDAVGHSFVVAEFVVEGKKVYYLIDPTYVQFFKKENCNEDCYITINDFIVKTPDPGFFIKNGDRARIDFFNYYGFDILDGELARIYGNSFYNTRTMKKSKKFEELDGDDYINSFLKNGIEKLSKTKDELFNEDYYIDFKRKNVR